MVQDYTTELYEPAADHIDRMSADGHGRAKDLADWKRRVLDAWHGVHVDSVESDGAVTGIGDARTVDAVVSLGVAPRRRRRGAALHGVVGQGDELESPRISAMVEVEHTDDVHVRYRGDFACDAAGRYGFTVRVVPAHPDLAASAELGRDRLGLTPEHSHHDLVGRRAANS